MDRQTGLFLGLIFGTLLLFVLFTSLATRRYNRLVAQYATAQPQGTIAKVEPPGDDSAPDTVWSDAPTPSTQSAPQTPASTPAPTSSPAVFHSSVPCYNPMAEADFETFKSNVDGKASDEDKLRAAKDGLTENCLSTAQIETILNLFWREETKLEWAKFAYQRCTDHEHYEDLYDSLTPSSESKLRDYIGDHRSSPTRSTIITGTESPGMPCVQKISEEDFTELKEAVKDKASDSGKLDAAKDKLGSNCLTVAQVEEVMLLFSFLHTKLDWAKFAYHRTSDQENYPDLYDSLGSASSEHELRDYIEEQQNR